MSSHIAPHVLATLANGQLGAGAAAAHRRHIDGCASCQAALARVTAAVHAFGDVAATPAPELPWEAIRTQVRWKVDAAQREPAAGQSGRRWMGWSLARAVRVGLPVAAVASVGWLWWSSRPAAGPIDTKRVNSPASWLAGALPAAQRDAALAAPLPAAPVALQGQVTKLAGGAVVVDGERYDVAPAATAMLFQKPIVVGTTLATADAALHVQFGAFGDQSAFALGPNSTVGIRRFDATGIELTVDGTLDVTVSPRAAQQHFWVLAGTRKVEVRGTQFRVDKRGDELTVACLHGQVVTSDGVRSVVVAAQQVAHVPADAVGSASAWPVALPLAARDQATLLAATPLALAPASAADSQGIVVVPAPANRHVRIDGLDAGAGYVAVRTATGRHRVEVTDAAGRFHGSWLAVGAAHGGATLFPVSSSNDDAERGRAARRAELRRRLPRAAIAACGRTIAKQGLAGGTVTLEVVIDAAGNIGAVNTVDADVAVSISSCVRDQVGGLALSRGAATTLVERIQILAD